jgi:hypothetical protein
MTLNKKSILREFIMKKFKPINLVISGALFSTLLFSGGMSTYASTDSLKGNDNKQEIQGAYYYIDGVEYEIPAKDLEAYASGNANVDLPYDPQKVSKGKKKIKQIGKTKNKVGGNIGTLGYACVPGYEFDGSRSSAGFQLGKSGARVINDTSNPLYETSQLGSDATVSGKVTGSGTWDWGPIEATAGFEIGGSYTWKTSESTKIEVDPGDWGWIDYGTHSETWKGYYYYLTSTCGQSGKTWLSVKGPKYKAKLARTEHYPY